MREVCDDARASCAKLFLGFDQTYYRNIHADNALKAACSVQVRQCSRTRVEKILPFSLQLLRYAVEYPALVEVQDGPAVDEDSAVIEGLLVCFLPTERVVEIPGALSVR